MKVFEIKYKEQTEWIAATNIIKALEYYFSVYNLQFSDFSDEDSMREIYQETWSGLLLTNVRVDDLNNWESITLEEYMEVCDTTEIIGRTMD